MRTDSEEYLNHLDHSIKEIGRNGFQQEVTNGFVQAGSLAYHTHNSRNSLEGYPDSMVPLMLRAAILEPFRRPAGAMVLTVIELKCRDNTPSNKQIGWLDALRRCGALTFCLWPRHRPVLGDLYDGLITARVLERLHVYEKRTL